MEGQMEEMITKERVWQELKRLAQENPDNLNPKVHFKNGDIDGCVYTDPNDPTKHCIAGELLSIFYPERLPDVDSESNWEMSVSGLLDYDINSKFTPDAKRLMQVAQNFADGWETDHRGNRKSAINTGPRPWGQVIALIEEII
jgi:hypothetical protein